MSATAFAADKRNVTGVLLEAVTITQDKVHC